MQPLVTAPRHIAADTLSQLHVTELIQTACEAFELRISAQIKANSFALLAQIQQLRNQSTRLDHQSIPAVATCAAEGGMEALAAPFDSLPDDHDLLASNVVDFTPVREVKVSDPSSKTWPDAIATRSDSLLKPPIHGDFSAITQPPTPPSRFQVCVSILPLRLAQLIPFGIDFNLTPLRGYRQPPIASGAPACALASPCARRPTLTLTHARQARRR
jgi:hypothetical protein